MPLWTSTNRGSLAKELLVSLSKVWQCYEVFLLILQNDLPSSTQMDGPCVKFFEYTLCSMTVLVSCFLRQLLLPCCSILPKYKKEFENPSPRSLFTFHVSAQLSHLVAVRQARVASI
jgi:hypothetical protein